VTTTHPRTRSNANEIQNLLVAAWTSFTLVHADGSQEHQAGYDETVMANQLVPYHNFLDEVHAKRSNGKYPLSDCDHWSADFPTLPRMQDIILLPSGDQVFWTEEANYLPIGRSSIDNVLGWGNAGTNLVVAQAHVPDAVRADLCWEAFVYFSEVFPVEINSSEFIQGLFQLKALLPVVEDSLLQTLAGGYLNKSFGWDNVLSDLDALSGMFEAVADRIKYLLKTAGIPTRLGFARHHVNPLLQPFEDWHMYEPVYANGWTGSDIQLRSYTCSFHASAWVTQTVEYIDGIVGWLRGITSSLGLNNPVKAAWQIIPFSFVVDWFVDVSGHLDRLTRIQPAVGWNVFDFSYSFKHEFEWDLSQRDQHDTIYDRLSQTVPLKVTYYERRKGLPVDTGLLDLSNLSYSQAALLLALGIVA